MKIDWAPLRTELAIWRAEALALPIWWRDDDAIEDTPALHQLLRLSEQLEIPAHLAVIPKQATPALAALCKAQSNVTILIHGWAHQNHAPKGAKKAEFGHPRAGSNAETSAGLARLQSLFGSQLLEMFVPPWNRIDESVSSILHAQGYRALSTYTPRRAKLDAGLIRINTHVDPIHWKGGGGLSHPEALVTGLVHLLQARRLGAADAEEPLGFLTHHLVHDEAIWGFTERCLSELLEGGATPCNLQGMKSQLP